MDRTYVIDLDEIPGLWRSGVNLRPVRYARKAFSREKDGSLTYHYFLYDYRGRLCAVCRRHGKHLQALAPEEPAVRDLLRLYEAPERLDVWDMALYPYSQVDGDRIKTWSDGHFTFRPRPDAIPDLSPGGRMLLSGSVFA